MYANGKIYKLVNEELGLTYYGSTTLTLNKRFSSHKSYSSNNLTSKHLFEKGQVKIILVEDYPCNEKIDLLKRERYYIENNECVNKNIPSRTIKESNKNWFDNNKNYQKEYRENNKEYKKKTNKEYHENNKKKLNEYSSKYRQKNKEILNKKSKEKFNCICGGQYIKAHKSRHLKSKKHQTFLNT